MSNNKSKTKSPISEVGEGTQKKKKKTQDKIFFTKNFHKTTTITIYNYKGFQRSLEPPRDLKKNVANSKDFFSPVGLQRPVPKPERFFFIWSNMNAAVCISNKINVVPELLADFVKRLSDLNIKIDPENKEIYEYVESKGIYNLSPYSIKDFLHGKLTEYYQSEDSNIYYEKIEIEGGSSITKAVQIPVAKHVRDVYSACSISYLVSKLGKFTNVPDGIPFDNIILKLNGKSKEIPQEIKKEHCCTYKLNTKYLPGEDCKTWKWFLNDIFRDNQDREEIIRYIQSYLYLCLSGNATKSQKALMFLGCGRNGKSVLGNIIKDLFQDFSTDYDLPKINEIVSNGKGVEEFSRALINITDDAANTAFQNSSGLKTLISGASQSSNMLYSKKMYKFKPKCGYIINANELPQFSDSSDGTYRRFSIIEFKRKYGNGGDPEDPNLYFKLKKELSGILNWILEGRENLNENGSLDSLKSSDELIDDYKSVNPMVAFVNSFVEDEKSSISVIELNKMYNELMKSMGITGKLQTNNLNSLFTAKFPNAKFKSSTMHYRIRKLTKAEEKNITKKEVIKRIIDSAGDVVVKSKEHEKKLAVVPEPVETIEEKLNINLLKPLDECTAEDYFLLDPTKSDQALLMAMIENKFYRKIQALKNEGYTPSKVSDGNDSDVNEVSDGNEEIEEVVYLSGESEEEDPDEWTPENGPCLDTL